LGIFLWEGGGFTGSWNTVTVDRDDVKGDNDRFEGAVEEGEGGDPHMKRKWRRTAWEVVRGEGGGGKGGKERSENDDKEEGRCPQPRTSRDPPLL
jgi:hypothetical protein